MLNEILKRDTYEVRCLAATGFVPKTIVDIGCQQGIFGYWARSFWPACSVYGFDPYGVVGHFAVNVPGGVLVRKGVYGFWGQADLDYGDPGWMDTPEWRLRHAQNSVSATEAMRFVGLDGIDLLKLDCEGCETNILREWVATGFISRIRHVTGEWHGLQNKETIQRLLEPYFDLKVYKRYPCAWDMFIAHRRETSASTPLVSLLIPHRRETNKMLKDTLESFMGQADDPQHVEVLVRLDDDQPQLQDGVQAKILFGPRYRGYRDLHCFYNELAAASTGDWLWMLNDDVRMETKGWDTRLTDMQHRNAMGITELWPKLRAEGEVHPWYNAFPVVSRPFYRLLGHFSQSPLSDCYVRLLALAGGFEQECPITVEHRVVDSTGPTPLGQQAAAYHYSAEAQRLIDEDRRKFEQAGFKMRAIDVQSNSVVYT